MFVLAGGDVRLMPTTLVRQLHFGLFKLVDQLHLLADFITELLLFVEDLLHGVVLREGETGATSHNLVKMGNLLL